MPNLYEKFTNGDRRTVVKKFRKGDELSGPNNSVFVIKADVTMKVTEEYNAAFKKWWEVIYHVDDMVESDNRPAPTTMPGEPEQREAFVKKTWFERLFWWAT